MGIQRLPSKEKLNQALGNTIRKLREIKGISQNKLGVLSGMHRSYIGDLEQGTRNISVWNLVRIGAALDTTGSKILETAESIWQKSQKRSSSVLKIKSHKID